MISKKILRVALPNLLGFKLFLSRFLSSTELSLKLSFKEFVEVIDVDCF